MFRLSKNLEFNKQLSQYLYKGLKENGLVVKKDKVLINVSLNNNDNILIDCLAGKVYINKENEKEKYLCSLSNFKNKTHLGEAYNCAAFNVDKLIKKINNINNDELIKESSIKLLDLRKQKDVVDLRKKKTIVDLRTNTKLVNKIIYYINNTIKEANTFLNLHNFFIKFKNISKKQNGVFGIAYKDERKQEIFINKNELKNITVNDFQDVLKKEYPRFIINKEIEQNRISIRVGEKKYSQEAYDWVKDRAELLMQEDLDSDMAYGIAWMQYKKSQGE